MSERTYCKDCRFYENGLCHRIPPVSVFNGLDVVCGYSEVELVETEELSETKRGMGGYGSTGK